MKQLIQYTTTITAPVPVVWQYLTDRSLIKQWMGEPGMNMEIITTWEAGTPLVIKGFHHVNFENKGTILEFEPDRILTYNYLSSISRLPDIPENYTRLCFKLDPLKEQTLLTLSISNFPSESIYRHVDFYWKTTLSMLKSFIEHNHNQLA